MLAAAVALVFYPTFRGPPRAKYPPPASLAEAQLQDLHYLRKVMAIDRSFTSGERARFNEAVRAIQRKAGKLDRAAFEMEVSRAVAASENAHTNLLGAGRGLDLNSLPLRAVWFEEGLFVVSAAADRAGLLGARILAIEGRAPDALASAVAPAIGGTAAFKREMAPNILLSPQALYALGLAAAPSRARVALRLPDGRQVEGVIPAMDRPLNGPAAADQGLRLARELHWPRLNLSPRPSAVDPPGLRHVLYGRDLPLYLQAPDRFYWYDIIQERSTLYVQINAARDQPEGPSLPDFLASVLAEAKWRAPRDAIVDLRFNAGGNYLLTSEFARELPDRLPADGRVYIVVSGNTWSAGLVTAARLKYFAGKRAVIVGEEMGDGPQFWAEGKRASLPNLGLGISYATAYHDWKKGCSWREIGVCYWLNYLIGVPAGDLSPMIVAPIRYADYIKGEDTAMKAIKAHQAER